MTAIFGCVLCLLAIMPAFSVDPFSLDPFYWLIGKSTRPHDLLGLFRFAVQTLANVSSPFKIGMILAVATGAFLAGFVHPSRIAALLVVGLATLLGSAQVLLLGRSSDIGAVVFLVLSAVFTLTSCGWASRHALINAS